ncbi:ATP-binding protein [Streptacidiphilus sp. 4-A2]|nr:ATP-binding protein [Streptacidiphilus sp. 4-A2]
MSVLASRPVPLGPRGFRVEPAAYAVSAARRLITDTVASWELPLSESDLCDVELLSSELITNAVVHTAAACAVCVRWTGERLRVEVTDSEPALPAPASPDLAAQQGRGLLLVAALAASWGAEPDPAGKRVWFEVAPSARLLGDERLTALVRAAAPFTTARTAIPDPTASPASSRRDGERSHGHWACAPAPRRWPAVPPSARRLLASGSPATGAVALNLSERASGPIRILHRRSAMHENLTSATEQDSDGLLIARTRVAAARSRAEQPSDGGSTGVSDTND